LLAGAAGVEWYFGADYPGNDLSAEDWRSRELIWDQTRYALQFMQRNVPFHMMAPANHLSPEEGSYCFAQAGVTYVIYTPGGLSPTVDLQAFESGFDIFWYNPREGGDLQRGSTEYVRGPGLQALGKPPGESDKDWVILLK